MATEAADPEFSARLADVCWTTQKKPTFPLVAIAIEAYVASSSALTKAPPDEKDIDHLKRWDAAVLRLRRATQLANSTNHKLLSLIQSTFDGWLAAHFDEIPLLELGALLTAYPGA